MYVHEGTCTIAYTSIICTSIICTCTSTITCTCVLYLYMTNMSQVKNDLNRARITEPL